MNIDFFTVYTNKIEESIAFYTKTLGLTVKEQYTTPGGVTLVFLCDEKGTTIELVDTGQILPEVQHSPVALTIKIPCMIKTEKMVDELGHEKIFGPLSMPGGITLMHIADPNGVVINFVQMVEE